MDSSLKTTVAVLATSLLTLGCSPERESRKSGGDRVGIANPASEFCAQKGGTSESRQDAEGNAFAMCHLPDGRVIEEWALFRSESQTSGE